MILDDPEKRRAFRRQLSEIGLSEVRYRLDAEKYSKQKIPIIKQWIADVESGATIEDDLFNVIDRLNALKNRFVHGGNFTGLFLRTVDQASYEQLFIEAKTLINERLGPSNDYSARLIEIHRETGSGFVGGPSLACVTETVEIIRGAVKQMQRKPTPSPVRAAETSGNGPYVDPSRLDDIRSVSSSRWDFARLAQMCAELNAAYENQAYISVTMLVRAIIDHVPPIFGKTKFAEVANHHGGRSFQASMKNLDVSIRKIGDAYLHEQIRSKETLPSAVQVDVRRELDVLLAEIVRLVAAMP